MSAEFKPGRWWRVTFDNGRVWCESSDEDEVRESLETAPGGGVLQRIYERTERVWQDEP